MILKIIVGVVVALVILVVIVVIAAMMQPNEFTVQRSLPISAPPEIVFSHINDLKKWEAWSPWEKLDPDMRKTYTDNVVGEGASYSWDGDSNIGEGSLTIVKSTPDQQIDMDLKFIRPFACENDVVFTFVPNAGQTTITWKMDGKNTFFSKVMCLFMSMDNMVGSQFAEGLENLKKIAEEEAKPTSPEAADTPS
ncbi:SRPBCC family protein [Blastopirellula sp. J2-11]|uniref:SRPBCC family protein n=1 Tax=Blastopirellula sp. J2-11 TaxID=2943192 RepID=UPI0021C63D45|nr:SRPBCC family protein [Blastopirellula sp. J2-11]UUO08880.1 SRPBCC family protein [Blastopirellula sp. J2-11]